MNKTEAGFLNYNFVQEQYFSDTKYLKFTPKIKNLETSKQSLFIIIPEFVNVCINKDYKATYHTYDVALAKRHR